jgi:hypothetical protein
LREAACQCGGLSLLAAGDPDFINICYCAFCQRRTGSVFSSNAYFYADAVTITGSQQNYSRPAGNGRMIENFFCPRCGATVSWRADLRPRHIGVAIGAFVDPAFPSPMVSLWEQSAHPWLALPESLPRFPQGLTDDRQSR